MSQEGTVTGTALASGQMLRNAWNLTHGNDKIMNNGRPCDAPHERHNVSGGGSSVDDVDHCLVITHNGDALPFPGPPPDETGHSYRIYLIQR